MAADKRGCCVEEAIPWPDCSITAWNSFSRAENWRIVSVIEEPLTKKHKRINIQCNTTHSSPIPNHVVDPPIVGGPPFVVRSAAALSAFDGPGLQRQQQDFDARETAVDSVELCDRLDFDRKTGETMCSLGYMSINHKNNKIFCIWYY